MRLHLLSRAPSSFFLASILLAPLHAETPSVHIQSTGISAGNFLSTEGLTVWIVLELETGNGDLNGDGDMLDPVLHVHRTDRREIENLELAGFPIEVASKRALLLVRERDQNDTDLNNDGDTDDFVFHVYDARTGVVTNLGHAGFIGMLSDKHVVVSVAEALRGGDLNGDGDTIDLVLHLYEFATREFTNLGLAAVGLPNQSMQTTGNTVAFAAAEAANGNTDFNDDGDTDDNVVHVYTVATGELQNLGLAASSFDEPPAIQLTDRWLACTVDERSQGSDLDGDGDALDPVVHLVDLRTDVVTNLQLTVEHILNDFVLSEEVLAVRAIEWLQGQTDLNGDGDLLDSVMFVRSLQQGVTLPLGVAVAYNDEFALSDGLLLCRVDEDAQGATDLNGDGDATDRVAHVAHVTMPTGDPVQNLELATANVFAQGRWAALDVPEFAQGNRDLNGDGDTGNDNVLFVYDTATRKTQNLRLAVAAVDRHVAFHNNSIVFFVNELGQNGDRNGDGDMFDLVPRVQSLPTGLGLDFGVSGANANPGMSLAGSVLAFRVSEGNEGLDLNGDGDIYDMVLHFARLAPPSTLGRSQSR